MKTTEAGNVYATVVIRRADDALFCHDADHGKTRRSDAYLLAERVDAVEQVFSDAGTENCDTLGSIVFRPP